MIRNIDEPKDHTSANSNDGVLYWTLRKSGTIRTMSIYKASGMAAGDLVAQGSRTGDGAITLSAQNDSGLSGTYGGQWERTSRSYDKRSRRRSATKQDELDRVLREAVAGFPNPMRAANGLLNLFAALRRWAAVGGDVDFSYDRNLLATWRAMTEESK